MPLIRKNEFIKMLEEVPGNPVIVLIDDDGYENEIFIDVDRIISEEGYVKDDELVMSEEEMSCLTYRKDPRISGYKPDRVIIIEA